MPDDTVTVRSERSYSSSSDRDGLPSLSGEEILRCFEDVLVNNLGDVGRFLLETQLIECGKTRSNFTENDVDQLIICMKRQFYRVIGNGVEKLELDLRKAIRSLKLKKLAQLRSEAGTDNIVVEEERE